MGMFIGSQEEDYEREMANLEAELNHSTDNGTKEAILRQMIERISQQIQKRKGE